MKQQNGFTLMTIGEFEEWLPKQNVSRKISLIQEHHTWSPSYVQFNGSNHFSLQSGMKSYHLSIGYADIAQQFTTFEDGMICTGRSMNTAPAGIRGANSNGICIENLGNFDKGNDAMTQEQRNTVVRMAAALLKKFGLNAATGITYHCWWTDSGTYLGGYVPGKSCKTCPGTNFFGGNTKASYDKNLRPLIEAAMSGKKENEMTKTEIQELVKQTIKQMDVPTTAKNAAKAAAQDVVQSTFQTIYSNANPKYDTLEQVPEWGKDTARKLVNKGFLIGEGDGLGISYDLLRILVVNDRAHLYGD